jgi:hypothetical protein
VVIKADASLGSSNVGKVVGGIGVTVRRRRVLSVLIIVLVVVTLRFGFGHRGIHAIRSMAVPGAGLYDHRHGWLGATFTVAAIVATVCWLRWGMDWLMGLVVGTSMVAAAALAYTNHPPQLAPANVGSAHEFPLVLLVVGAMSALRVVWRKSSFGRWQTARARASGRMKLSPLEQCTEASIHALALSKVGSSVDSPSPLMLVDSSASPTVKPEVKLDVGLDVDRLMQRCRRVGIAARGRFGGDPMRTDHAHVRAALLLTGELDENATERFRADAMDAPNGVPSSEPGWLRLLDATLAACALQYAGDDLVGNRWASALNGPFALQRGHRPGAVWTPLALRGPRAPTWQHCAATGIARAAGWISNDDDWLSLRTGALAAAARGNAVVDDERLVAAGRLWLAFVDDEQASRILGRVTIGNDQIAVSLDTLVMSLRADPTLLRLESTN